MVIVIVLTALLAFMEFRATQGNIGAVWNGYGAAHGVLTKTGVAPGRYRVLVPWLLGPVPRKHRLAVYLVLKIILLSLSLAAAWAVIGTMAVILLAVFIAVTFEFDYWDCYVEIMAVCLILTGNPWWTLLGAVLWGLSKETVFFAVPLALCSGGLVPMAVSLVGPAIFIGVMKYQGKAELYSKRWSRRKMRIDAWKRVEHNPLIHWLGIVSMAVVGSYNPGDLKASIYRKDAGIFISIFWSLLAVALSFTVWGTELAQTYWIGLGWVLAGWVLIRVRETRAMLPSAIWMAMALVNYA